MRSSIPPSVRREVLSSGECSYCGQPYPTDVDHVIPVSRGGTGERQNLTAACSRCNWEKRDFTPDEWREWRLRVGLPWPPQDPVMECFFSDFGRRLLAESGGGAT